MNTYRSCVLHAYFKIDMLAKCYVVFEIVKFFDYLFEHERKNKNPELIWSAPPLGVTRKSQAARGKFWSHFLYWTENIAKIDCLCHESKDILHASSTHGFSLKNIGIQLLKSDFDSE